MRILHYWPNEFKPNR